jgi:AraC-like DNA-binding protein
MEQLNFSIYSIPLILGFLHSNLFAGLLFYRSWSQKRLSDFLLGLLLVCASLLIMPYMLGFMGVEIMWNELLFFPNDPGLIIGPVIYFYLVSQTNNDFTFQKRDAWHLLPFAIYLAYHLIVFFQGKSFVHYWIANVDLPYIGIIFEIGTLISNYFYLYLAIRHYSQYRKWIETVYSNTEEIKLSWYRNFLFIVSFGVTISWIFNAVEDLGSGLSYTQSWWEYLFIVIIIYIFSIQGYNQTQTVYIYFESKNNNNSSTAQLPDEKEIEKWKKRIEQLMEEKQLFLQPELTLRQIAVELKAPSSTISQVINAGFDKNFNTFINDYRIEAFKKQAKDPAKKHLSLLAIAMDCGFNSKATFNRVFKNSMGISPSKYLNREE